MTDVPFSTLDEFASLLRILPAPDENARAAAEARNGELTKPPGALGRLEELAIWFASWQGKPKPKLEAPQIIIFAGNHGMVANGVSAFPAEVTAQMVSNFEAGGAAINQLAKCFGAKFDIHELSLENPTADFTKAPAMNDAECTAALTVGWNAVDTNADLLVVGEMGIGNTTSAAALGMALFGGESEDWVGRGTGVDDAGLARKAEVVRAGVAMHEGDPLQLLAALGGRELAAMVGAIARARVERIPVILDGFICTVAASVLEQSRSGALDHAVAGHLSEEGGHRRVLTAIGKEPILDLGLRLGEGSGGALAIGILQGAIACHSGMATFSEAAVSEG